MPTRDDKITIAVDEEHIAGTIVTPGTVVPGVLFLHGWGGSQEQYLARAREIAALGCVALTVDLRGHVATEQASARRSRGRTICATRSPPTTSSSLTGPSTRPRSRS